MRGQGAFGGHSIGRCGRGCPSDSPTSFFCFCSVAFCCARFCSQKIGVLPKGRKSILDVKPKLGTILILGEHVPLRPKERVIISYLIHVLSKKTETMCADVNNEDRKLVCNFRRPQIFLLSPGLSETCVVSKRTAGVFVLLAVCVGPPPVGRKSTNLIFFYCSLHTNHHHQQSQKKRTTNEPRTTNNNKRQRHKIIMGRIEPVTTNPNVSPVQKKRFWLFYVSLITGFVLFFIFIGVSPRITWTIVNILHASVS